MKLKFISLSPNKTEVHQTIYFFCCFVVIEIGKICTLKLKKKLPFCLIIRFIIHLNCQNHQYQDELEVSITCYITFTNQCLRKMDAV